MNLRGESEKIPSQERRAPARGVHDVHVKVLRKWEKERKSQKKLVTCFLANFASKKTGGRLLKTFGNKTMCCQHVGQTWLPRKNTHFNEKSQLSQNRRF